MTGVSPQVLEVLVDLSEVFEQLNTRIVREAERRAGVEEMPRACGSVALHVLRHPRSTEQELVDASGLSTRMIRRAVAILLRNDALVVDTSRGEARYSAGPMAVELRDRSRARSSQHLRYALTDLSEADRRRLDQALDALGALTRGLGYERPDPGPS